MSWGFTLLLLEGLTTSQNLQPDSVYNQFSLDHLMWDGETCKHGPLSAPPFFVPDISMAVLSTAGTRICECCLPVVSSYSTLWKSYTENFMVCVHTSSLWVLFGLTCNKASRSSATEELLFLQTLTMHCFIILKGFWKGSTSLPHFLKESSRKDPPWLLPARAKNWGWGQEEW